MEATGCRIVRYAKTDAEFSLWDVADIHYLNRGCFKEQLRQDIQKIKNDPYSFAFLGGDYADWISIKDKRFDPEAFDEDLRVIDLTRLGAYTLKAILDYLSPLTGKWLGACMGNHEQKYMTANSEKFIHDQLCHELKTVNMGYSGWADIYFVHDQVKTPIAEFGDKPPRKFTARLRNFVHHGAGSSATAGGKINMIKRLVDMVNADLVMTSHLHEQLAKAFVRLEPNADCSEVQQRVTMALMTGSYLRTYAPGFTGYGEPKAYAPATLGASRARYKPSTMELTVENRADGVGMRGGI